MKNISTNNYPLILQEALEIMRLKETHKLTVVDISKALELESFVYPQPRYDELRKIIREEKTKKALQCAMNTKFLLQLDLLFAQKNKDEKLYGALKFFLLKLLNNIYNEKCYYNWYEMKAVRWYCTFMCASVDYSDFALRLNNPHFEKVLMKYVESDKAIHEKYKCNGCRRKQKSGNRLKSKNTHKQEQWH